MSAERIVDPAAVRYDRHVAPFARPFAEQLVATVDWSALDHRADSAPTILDHGAGTGLLTRLVHDRVPNVQVTALDPSIELATALPDEPWCRHIRGVESDLATDAQFDVLVSNLVLMFCPDPALTVGKLLGVTRPGGQMALCVLGSAEQVQPFHTYWSIVADVVPDAWLPHRYPHHQFDDPRKLAVLLSDAGWKDCCVEPVETHLDIGADDAWQWLSGALPIGVGDRYTAIEPAQRERVRTQFLRTIPHRLHSVGLIASGRAAVR